MKSYPGDISVDDAEIYNCSEGKEIFRTVSCKKRRCCILAYKIGQTFNENITESYCNILNQTYAKNEASIC